MCSHSQGYYKGDLDTMAKKPAVAEDQAIMAPLTLTPANVVGLENKVEIDLNSLPKEFKNIKFEVIQTGFSPTVKWENPGEFVAGVYEGMEEKTGPNNTRLYNFDAKGKLFGVWGTTVLDRAFDNALKSGILRPGYMVIITFVATTPSDFEDHPTKLFTMHVAKK